MRIFEIVKGNVNLREVAELYGIDVNRYGKALCPFHNDRNPSLYVADDHYYCFACGEHGDIIDFVRGLFQLSPYDAARKLMADFHLSSDKPPSAAALHAKRIRIITTRQTGGLHNGYKPLMPTRVSRRGLSLCSSLRVFATLATPKGVS